MSDNQDQLTLTGDAGRRTVRTEWGTRHGAGPCWPAGVDEAADRVHAQAMARTYGQGACVVTRTVVTYTTVWTRSEGTSAEVNP